MRLADVAAVSPLEEFAEGEAAVAALNGDCGVIAASNAVGSCASGLGRCGARRRGELHRGEMNR